MKDLHVLVVDDDAVLGALLAEMLHEMGLHVCGVETTQNGAIAAALRLKPDVMLVDASLSPGSGLAVMAAVALHGRIPHVFMSGTRLAITPQGPPVLLKPFSEESLAAAIGDAVGMRFPFAAPVHE